MKHKVSIHFLGGAGEVTGSKFLLETSEQNILIDCGMFQGIKRLRELNWENLPFDASKIDIVLLTHGHLDHVGYLPRLVKQGFKGKIIGTGPTLAIAGIILKDSAKIHEEEAEKANTEKYSKHHPALPFYTREEAEEAIAYFHAAEKDEWKYLSENIMCQFKYNGHILGACYIELDVFGKRFMFSGDIGREEDLLLHPPEKPEKADVLFMESTYGDREHPDENVENILTEAILDTIHKRGNLIIPSFAVERAQTLMYLLWQMYKKNSIPNIPVIVDSPMGANVLQVFRNFMNWHKVPQHEFDAMVNHVNIVQSFKETWAVIDDKRPKIIIAGSGMVTGGRVLTYLDQFIDKEETTVLLVGYQAEGTRGRYLQDGVSEIKFYGRYRQVKASVKHIQSLSAHAGQSELLNWLKNIENKPEKVYLIHGEPASTNVLRVKINDIFGWNVKIPQLYETEIFSY